MDVREMMERSVAALVEYYDDSAACDGANRVVAQVQEMLGADAPVYRINVGEDRREGALARITEVPTVIIYRSGREEWRMTGSEIPDAATLAARLQASDEAAGAVNPLKGVPRY